MFFFFFCSTGALSDNGSSHTSPVKSKATITRPGWQTTAIGGEALIVTGIMFHFFCCDAVYDLSPARSPLLNHWLWCGSHSWLFTLPIPPPPSPSWPPPPHARHYHQPLTPVPSRPQERKCDTFSMWNRKVFVSVSVCTCVGGEA